MKILSALTFTLLMIFQTVCFAATETFSASGEYLMSDYDTPEIAEEIALDFAKQSAAEQAGIYLESYSRSANFNLEDDEIKTVASSKVEVLEKNITRQPQDDGRILLRADIRATVDTSELDAFIKQEREKRQAAIQRYKKLQEMNAKIKRDIDTFQVKLAAIRDAIKDDELIVEQERINREFLAIKKSEEFGKKLGESKNFAADIALIDEAIKFAPKIYWLYVERSALASSPMPNLKDVSKAIILAPDVAQPYMMRGAYYSASGNFNQALQDYNKAVELAPQNTWSYINRAYFYEAYVKDYGKARADYDTAIKLDPKNGHAYKSRGKLYRELKKYNEAIKDYETAIKIDAKNFNGFDYLNLGDIYKELGDYPHALDNYTKAIELAPQFAFANHRLTAYLWRAAIYCKQGNFDKALADYDKVLELDPNNEIAKDNRQLVLDSLKK